MADARRGTPDVVLVFRFDPFARSVKQLIQEMEEFRSLHRFRFAPRSLGYRNPHGTSHV